MFKILVNNGLEGAALAFTELPANGLDPLLDAKLEFGDFNGDGYADVLYSGLISGQGKVSKLAEYDPTTSTFVESDFDLEGITDASVAFGDMDGDNDLDFVISGVFTDVDEDGNEQGTFPVIGSFLNVRNESAAVLASSGGSDFTSSSATDGFTTTPEYIVNEKPSTPEGLFATQISFDTETDTYDVEFAWNESVDDNTPSAGLTYALKVGTSEGASDIMKVNALTGDGEDITDGYRTSAGKGNVEHNLKWSLNLPDGTYFFSIQAIDASYAGSEFSETVEFSTYEAPILEASYSLDVNDATISIETDNFDIGDGADGDGYWNYSVDGGETVVVSSGAENAVLLNLPNGDHTVLIWLVDNNGDALVPPTEQTLNFTTLVNPAMEASVSTLQDVATLSITTEDFVIGTTETDDGYWTYSLNGGETVSVYTTDDLELLDLPNGDHTILISLVDSSGTALEPVVEQTITFSTFNGLAECDETVVYTQVANGDYTATTTALAGQYARVTINATMEAGYDSIIVTDGAGNQLNEQEDGEFVDDVYTSADGTITVQVLNDGSEQNGDVTLAFTCIDAPTITASVVVDGADATFTVETTNNEDGDWSYSLNGGDTVIVYTTELELMDLPNGDHTILFSLVDETGVPLDPAIEQTIEFSTYVAPTMTASVVVDGADATFTIATTNFVIGDSADADGHWHYELNGNDYVMAYTSELVLTDLPNGDHSILIWLVDSSHNPLDPPVEQIIEFSTFNGIPECGDTVTYSQVADGDYSISVTTDDDTLMASVTINATTEVGYDYIIVTDGAGTQLNTQVDGDFVDADFYSTDGTITVQVLNDSGVQYGDVTLVFVCVSLSTPENERLDMIIYPNPVLNGDFVTIQTSVNGEKYVEVFDITGKRLITTTLSADTLDVSVLSSGIYLVNVTINGQSKISKLIIR